MNLLYIYYLATILFMICYCMALSLYIFFVDIIVFCFELFHLIILLAINHDTFRILKKAPKKTSSNWAAKFKGMCNPVLNKGFVGLEEHFSEIEKRLC